MTDCESHHTVTSELKLTSNFFPCLFVLSDPPGKLIPQGFDPMITGALQVETFNRRAQAHKKTASQGVFVHRSAVHDLNYSKQVNSFQKR